MKGDGEQKSATTNVFLRRPIAARELFRGEREIAIDFRGDIYRLRITRNDKLILTK